MIPQEAWCLHEERFARMIPYMAQSETETLNDLADNSFTPLCSVQTRVLNIFQTVGRCYTISIFQLLLAHTWIILHTSAAVQVPTHKHHLRAGILVCVVSMETESSVESAPCCDDYGTGISTLCIREKQMHCLFFFYINSSRHRRLVISP